MQSSATSIEQYFEELPDDRRAAMQKLHRIVKKNLPKGFKEQMAYGMISYVVPHSKYPAGYHCTPAQALPFMCIASQKNFIAVYHMGIYAHKPLLEWFTDAYAEQGAGKLDMGKSCLRFKKVEKIPYDLIGELASKMTPDEWISVYESALKR